MAKSSEPHRHRSGRDRSQVFRDLLSSHRFGIGCGGGGGISIFYQWTEPRRNWHDKLAAPRWEAAACFERRQNGLRPPTESLLSLHDSKWTQKNEEKKRCRTALLMSSEEFESVPRLSLSNSSRTTRRNQPAPNAEGEHENQTTTDHPMALISRCLLGLDRHARAAVRDCATDDGDLSSSSPFASFTTRPPWRPVSPTT